MLLKASSAESAVLIMAQAAVWQQIGWLLKKQQSMQQAGRQARQALLQPGLLRGGVQKRDQQEGRETRDVGDDKG